MKQIAILFLTIFTLTITMSCKNDNEEILGTGLSGHWYEIKDNAVSSLYLDDNGTGQLTGYFWSQDKWAEVKVNLTYSTDGDNLIFKYQSGQEPLYDVARFVVSNNTLTLNSDEDTSTMTRYSGKKDKLITIFIDIEKKYKGVITTTPIPIEKYWQRESIVKSFIDNAMVRLGSFCRNQLILENALITNLDNRGYPINIRNSRNYGVMYIFWKDAFELIRLTNLIAYDTGKLGADMKIYHDQAIAIRAFVYYNMAMYWGKLPYITRKDKNEEYKIIPPNEIYTLLLKDIDNCDLSAYDGNNKKLNSDVLSILKKEIMSSATQNYSINIKSKEDIVLTVSGGSVENSNDNIWNNIIPIYTQKYIELLEKENTTDNETLLAEWKDFGSYRYGYWAMLRRKNLVQQVTNCKDYEILMPYPDRALDDFPGLTQNSGYAN